MVWPWYAPHSVSGHPVIHTLCELFTESVDKRGAAAGLVSLSGRADQPFISIDGAWL